MHGRQGGFSTVSVSRVDRQGGFFTFSVSRVDRPLGIGLSE